MSITKICRDEKLSNSKDFNSPMNIGRKVGVFGYGVDSPKVIIEKKHERITAFSAKKFFRKSESRYVNKNRDSFERKIIEKRDISAELLNGLDKEIKPRPMFSSFKSGKIKVVHQKEAKVLRNSFFKVCVFDKTVPESIIITSKTPISKKTII